MVNIYPLFSSSKGNATYIGNEKYGFLIDCGVSCKRICESLKDINVSPSSVKGIFVTHEHSDHINGIRVFSKTFCTPILSSSAILSHLENHELVSSNSKLINIENKRVSFLDYEVTPFQTPHDSIQSFGYNIKTPDNKKICTCTDLGEVTETVHQNLVGSDLVLFESNYDEYMLKNGSYPYMLKKRISSNRGHLSNIDSAREIEKLLKSGTEKIILGHLSQENNTPSKAKETMANELTDFTIDKDYLLTVAPVLFCGEGIELWWQ